MSEDIDPDRKFSNGTDWDNSIDWDDDSDGSDGGYDRHGSPINANAMIELVQLRMETSRLRAQLHSEIVSHADIQKAYEFERDILRENQARMREALRLVISDIIDYERANKLYPNPGKQHCWQSVRDALVLLEGATEPASLWQHKKTGGIYEIVGECQIEATNTPGVLYRNTSTGVTWVRPKEAFFDGRFEKVTPNPPANIQTGERER